MSDAREFVVENARFIFATNFAGKEGRFNREGQRGFNLVIDNPDLAQQLREDGWNVKHNEPEEGSRYEPDDYIPVAISYPEKFSNLWPEVELVTSKGRTKIGESEIGMLDYAEKKNVDVIIRPRAWVDDDGNKRIKAYLKKIVVVIEEDPLEQKYGDLPFSD